MKRVPVAVEPAYQVLVGAGALECLGELVPSDRVAVITDERVGRLHGEAACAVLQRPGRQVELIEVPPGEGSKSVAVFGELLSRLALAGLKREDSVVALGGGVVSDLAGFAAASYLRGVAFYSCPTTLLAMVDASVGGKTGLNLPEGKNLAGAFWQPRAVLADVSLLSTLPDGEFREGAVELYKHGLLGSPQCLEAIRDPEFRPGGSAQVLERYVAVSVEVKAAVVAADEREAGSRAHLNLGHSLAHALEAATGNSMSHGEAVAYGLLYAALLSSNRGLHDFTAESRQLLQWLSPSPLPRLEFDEVRPFMLRDKKNVGGGQRFVLLRGPGEPVVVDDVSEEEQRTAWHRLLEEVRA